MRQPPAYRAFTVCKAKEEGKKDAWIAIGAAWPHRDQKGIDVVLDALPLDGHVVLRLNEPNEERADEREARTPYAKKPARSNDRDNGPHWKRR